jgi:dTDP-4-dehydrorhamnose 3,5-epimerase
MIFKETPLAGAFIIELERREDERGYFARAWCQREFEDHGLNGALRQANVSWNWKRGTLRGMHYQIAPHGETKLVRCTRGAIQDTIIDMRPDSGTFLQHASITLTADNGTMLYVPEEFAHGFITLQDHTEVTYQVSEFYTPGAERGLRYDDPAIGIEWPLEVEVISAKDAGWPDFQPVEARQAVGSRRGGE